MAVSRTIILGALALSCLLAAAPAQADRIRNNTAVFSGLDKITGRIISFKATLGETVQFGSLQVTSRACYTRPAKEAPQTDTFVEIDELSASQDPKRIFSGWMFAASPGLHGLEHPIYDIWLTGCEQPGDTVVDPAQSAESDSAPAVPAPADAAAVPAAGAPPPPAVDAPKPRPRRVARPAPPRPDPDAVAEQPQEPRQRFFPASQYPTDLPEHDPAGHSGR